MVQWNKNDWNEWDFDTWQTDSKIYKSNYSAVTLSKIVFLMTAFCLGKMLDKEVVIESHNIENNSSD